MKLQKIITVPSIFLVATFVVYAACDPNKKYEDVDTEFFNCKVSTVSGFESPCSPYDSAQPSCKKYVSEYGKCVDGGSGGLLGKCYPDYCAVEIQFQEGDCGGNDPCICENLDPEPQEEVMTVDEDCSDW